MRESHQPEDDDNHVPTDNASDDVSSIGPSASVAGSPNRWTSGLRKTRSSIGSFPAVLLARDPSCNVVCSCTACALTKFRESAGLWRQDVVPFHRSEDLVHNYCSELPQCAVVLTPCRGSSTWPNILDRKGVPVMLMALSTLCFCCRCNFVCVCCGFVEVCVWL
jgi:hypothetical protein